MPIEIAGTIISAVCFLCGFLWGKDLFQPRKIEVFQVGYIIYVEVNGKLVYKGRLNDEGDLEESDARDNLPGV